MPEIILKQDLTRRQDNPEPRIRPGEGWQIDFTMRTKTPGSYWYLPVSAGIWIGCVEAFPCRSEKTSAVIKALLKEVIPRCHQPSSAQSDKGSAFIAKVTKEVSQLLGTQRKLHTSWRPQSTGKKPRRSTTPSRKPWLNFAKRLTWGGISYCLLLCFRCE